DLRGPRWRTPRALSCAPLPLALAPADPLALLTRRSAIPAQPKNCTARKAIPTERLTSPAALGGRDTLQKRATRTTRRTSSQEAFRPTAGPTQRKMQPPPGRRPLKVAATVLPPEAVIRMTLAPPSACRAAAGSEALLSM